MKELILKSWTDKKANTIIEKLKSFSVQETKSISAFDEANKKVESDNEIEINHSFAPENYRP